MRKLTRTLSVVAAGCAATLIANPALASLASHSTDFSDVTIEKSYNSSVWHMAGNYDAGIVTDAEGNSMLRISNALVSGSFGDQLFTPSLAVGATEDGPANVFEATFTLKPVELQPGLRVTVSPDNGQGGRAGFLSIDHRADGIALVTQGSAFDAEGKLVWNVETVATGLDASKSHEIKLRLVKKPNNKKHTNNDVFSVQLHGKPVANTTFEAYYQATGEANYETDTLLFRVSGTAKPEYAGKGLLIDDLSISTS